MIYGTLVGLVFVISLAYVVLVLANKEEGNMKLAGQILTALIVIIALVMLYFGATGRGHMGMMGKGMMGDDMMMGKCGKCMMMEKMMKDNPKMMDMKVKDMKMMMDKKMMSK
jgi:hypothetical protein